MKTRILSFLMLLLAAALPASAYDFMVNGLCYNYNEDGTSVTVTSDDSYSSLSGALIIPASVTYNGKTYSVTKIDWYAFRNCTGLTSVTFPSSINEVGGYAFDGCANLTKVNISDLTAWCNIVFHYYVSSNPLCFAHNLYLNGTKVTNLTIPNTVTKIGNYTFYSCKGLTSVTIPTSVTSIGDFSFCGCSGLTSVTIPTSVTSIGYRAFSACSNIITVNWNATICANFEYIYRPFYELTNITTFNFGDSVNHIPTCLCYGLTGLTSVTIPSSVTSIGEYAFSGCSNIVTVNWNAVNCAHFTNTNKPFSGSNIKTFNFGNSVTRIPPYICYNLTGLTSVTIPNSITSIGNYAFSGCTGLTSVTIPNSVTTIGRYAFSSCFGLTSISFPNSLTTINNNAFYNCTGLTSITIPNSINRIENYAFNGCSNLMTAVSRIVTPQSVTYTYNNNQTNIFTGIPEASTLYVPKGTISNYQLEQYSEKPNPWLAFGNMCEVVDGDVNLDGSVTSADVTVVYNHLLNGDNTYIATSDIDSDGTITAADITAIYNMLLGQ